MNQYSSKPKNIRLKPPKQYKTRLQFTVSYLKCKYCGKDYIKNGKEKNGRQYPILIGVVSLVAFFAFRSIITLRTHKKGYIKT